MTGAGTDDGVGNKTLLVVAMVSFSLFAICEMVFARIAQSEALMGDAATMIIDGVSYGINLWAEGAKVGRSTRAQLWIDVVAPSVSTVALIGITIYVMIDALHQLKHNQGEENVNAKVMWIFAAVNLLLDFGNIAMFFVSKDPATGKWKLSCSSCSLCSRDNTGKSNLNMLSALAHVTADTLRSVAVMVAGLWTQNLGPKEREDGDAISAIIVSVAIAGSVIPLLWGICGSLFELYSAPGVGYLSVDTKETEEQLLSNNDIFNSDIEDDDEEIVPWRAQATVRDAD